MRYHSEIFGDILGIFLFVSQSLIYLAIGHFWGSTSETSGLVPILQILIGVGEIILKL